MDYVLEKHREHIVPIVYECLEQLYTKLRENNDIITFHRWKDLQLSIQKLPVLGKKTG
jgi:hypothetical protein